MGAKWGISNVPFTMVRLEWGQGLHFYTKQTFYSPLPPGMKLPIWNWRCLSVGTSKCVWLSMWMPEKRKQKEARWTHFVLCSVEKSGPNTSSLIKEIKENVESGGESYYLWACVGIL
jgi:hypothetical protein